MNKKIMRIALIYLGRRGGGSIYSLEIAKALAEKAEVLAVISRQAWNLKAWHKSGISLIEVPTYNSVLEFIPSTLNFRKHLALRRKIQQFNPDVLYYPMLHLWTPLINALLSSVPKVVTIHDPILHQGERNPVVALIQRKAIHQATRVIILSHAFTDTIQHQGMPRERIDVIPHGEFSYYSGLSSLQKGHHPPTLLFFGRISKYKGIEVLLKAFSIIKKQIPQARLLIVGSGDLSPYKKQLENLEDVTVINRWVKDEEVGAYFCQADVLVAPYTDASQSGVIPIAYAFRVPVITTQVGGLPEQVEDGKTGLLVPPGDAIQLARACVQLLTNPNEAVKLGQTGYEKAMKEWNWHRITDQVLVSLKKACGLKLEKRVMR